MQFARKGSLDVSVDSVDVERMSVLHLKAEISPL